MVFRVHTSRSRWPVTGQEPHLISAPDEVFAEVDGQKGVDTEVMGDFLRETSEDLAAECDEILHHAEWRLVRTLEQVRESGIMCGSSGCDDCLPKVQAALAEAQADGFELLAGILYFTTRIPPPPGGQSWN